MNTLTINRLPLADVELPARQRDGAPAGTKRRPPTSARRLSLSARRSPSASPSRARAHTAARKSPSRRSPGSRLTVFETFMAEENLAVETELTVRAGATVRLVQVQRTKSGSVLYSKITGTCAESGRIELVQVFPGSGDVYADTLIDLPADGGSFQADIGYLGQRSQTIDMNLVVNHFGRHTECEINASGALKNAAQKIFRGTIDFKNGSSDSVGNEKETVLMLGEDAVNKTVPLILCAEENVVGNHGATIGELDDETLFYFESRGIGRDAAENILARAAIERLARAVGDRETEDAILQELSEVL